jgi:hypothetical protein
MNACMRVIAAKPTDSATYDDELLLELDDDELLLRLLDELDDDDELLLDELLLELLDELDDDDELLLLDLRMEHAVCSGILCRWCSLAVSCMHAYKQARMCVFVVGCIYACMPVFVHALRYVLHDSRHVCVYACFRCMFFQLAFGVHVMHACTRA